MANAEVRVAIVGDNSDLQASLGESQSKLASFGKAVGKIAVAAGVAAAGGLAVLGKASIDAASAAQQSIGATETVFGKYADTVIKQSRRASTQLGLSQNDYRQNANVIGALLGNQGVAADKLAGKTRSLVKAGADMAATFGGTTTDAVNALASAFKGEFDPLEQYGISIKQAAVNTEAYRVANVETKKEFDALTTAQQNAAKQQATTNLLTKQGVKYQGAFAKETDTLAHQQQVLGAQWEDLKVKIGNALLPVVTLLFQRLTGELMPALQQLSKKYLPDVKQALTNIATGDPSAMLHNIADAVGDVDWGELAKGAGDLGDTLVELGPALAGISAEAVNDSLSVFNELIGFAADHLGLLRKVLPLIVAGYIALKSAQLLNVAVGKDSLIGGALQLAQTRQLIIANRELAVAIRETGTASGTMTGAFAGATSGINKMKVAAGAAAGAAGLGLVIGSTQVANDEVSSLMSVVGSAAMGAAAGSVFGPWGTAIGGAVGGLSGLIGSLGRTDDAMQDAKPAASDYARALDDITGASSEAARAIAFQALQEKGALPFLNQIGIGNRLAVDAIMGHKGALSQVQSALAEESVQLGIEKNRLDELYDARVADQNLIAAGQTLSAKDAEALAARTAARDAEIASLEESTKKRQTAIDAVHGEISAFEQQQKATREAADAVHVYSDAITKLPKDKRTQIVAEGVATSTRDIAKLSRKYDLTRKEVKTLIEASGVETTIKRVQRVQDRLKALGQTKPDLTRFSTGLNKFTSDLAGSAQRGGVKAGKALAEGTKQGAKVNLDKYKGDVRQGAAQAEGAARTGGTQVGAALKSGTLGGLSGLMSQLSGAVAAAVNAAIAAGKRAAKAQSPSKRMYELGEDIGDGLVLGVNSKQGDAKKAGHKLVDQLFGSVGGLDKITAGLDAITKMIDRVVNRRIENDKKAAKRTAAITDELKKQFKALRAIGKAQDDNTGKLDAARTAVEQYSAAIKESFVSFGDITQLGRLDSGKVSLSKLLSQLTKRRDDAAEFNALLQQLAAAGLDKAQIEQLTAAGPEAALATARAIASGGAQAITDINNLSRDIAFAGGQLGTALSDRFAIGGEKSALAYITKLEREQKRLDRTAQRMASALVKQLQAELAAVPIIKEPKKGKHGKTPDKDAVNGTNDKASTVNVKLTSQQVSQLERGREIQLDLDAYRSAGGRARV